MQHQHFSKLVIQKMLRTKFCQNTEWVKSIMNHQYKSGKQKVRNRSQIWQLLWVFLCLYLLLFICFQHDLIFRTLLLSSSYLSYSHLNQISLLIAILVYLNSYQNFNNIFATLKSKGSISKYLIMYYLLKIKAKLFGIFIIIGEYHAKYSLPLLG